MISLPGIAVHLGNWWRYAGDSAIRGHATVAGTPLTGQALADRLAGNPLEAFVQSADGAFAAVQARPDRVIAAVDRTRSVPLFYASHAGRALISDDAYWIAGQLPPESRDPIPEAEFLAIGYVTGRDTLHPRIKQLLAGETLSVTVGAAVVETNRYFLYGHGPYRDASAAELLLEWESTLARIIERLIRSVDGRPIVVPLSGGLDSRLLLLELWRSGYDNVRAFTYGVRGHSEGRIAEQVARELGVPWTHVEYTRDRWHHWYRSPEYAAYVRYADGLSAVAHVQDWPAVWEMQRAGQVPEDAVFMPGHNGGFLFGENGNLHRIAHPSLEDLVWNLERVHYHNWRVRDPRLRRAMRRRLVEAVGDVPLDRHGSATSAWERWEWQERQAKFMTNSVRVYEFWGFDWRLPYWDVEAIEFWTHVPLHLRARARLHRAYVEHASQRAGLSTPSSDRATAIRSVVMRDYVPERLKAIGRRIRSLRAAEIYERHPMGWYGVVSPEQFRRIYSGSETINSILALDRLGILPPSGDAD